MKNKLFMLFALVLFCAMSIGLQATVLNETFEFGGNLPLGWVNSTTDGGADWLFTQTNTHAATTGNGGTGYYAMLNSFSIQVTNNPVHLITPRLDLTTGSTTLTYFAWVGATAAANPLHIDVSTDGGANWTADVVVHNNTANVGTWHQYTLDLAAYNTSNNVRVRFSGISNDGSGLCNTGLDDVAGPTIYAEIPSMATLVAPLAAATGVSLSPTLNWGGGMTGGVPTGFKLYLGTDGAGTASPTNVVNGTNLGTVLTYAATGLLYNTTYYWQIVPTNTLGDATDCPIWSFTTMPDPTITAFPYSQNFDGVTAPALPGGWSTYVNSTSTSAKVDVVSSTTATHSTPNHARLTNSADASANLILIAPVTSLDINTSRVRFWAKGGASYSLIVGTMTNPTDPATFTAFQTVAPTATYAEYSVSFASYVGTDHYIAFKHGVGGTYRTIYIDDVVWEALPTSAVINVAPTSFEFGDVYNNGQTVRFVNVANSGTAPLTFTPAASDPSLTIVNTTEQTVAVGASTAIELRFHPTMEGTYTGNVTLTTNDPTHATVAIPVNANVLPALSTGLVQVGNGNLVDKNIPMDPYFGYTYSQTIYYQAELNTPNMQISKVMYSFNGHAAFEDNIKIYMGHTNKIKFDNATDWIPITQMTLVYDGPITTTATAGWVEVTLNTRFTYNNVDNLVVAFDENSTGYHDTADDFYATATNYTRTIEYHYDTTNPDPANPPAASTGNPKAFIPNTRFQFSEIPQVPIFTVNPANFAFPTVEAGLSSQAQTFTIGNTGVAPLVIATPIAITGTDAASFTLTDTNTYPISLTNGQTATVSVVFHPITVGNKTAAISIVDNTTRLTQSVQLTGVASAPFAFPYVVDFEGTTFPVDGWTVPTTGSSSWRLNTDVAYVHGGGGSAVVGYSAGDYAMISRPLPLTANGNQLRLWLRDHSDATSWDYDDEYLVIALAPNAGTNLTDFTVVLDSLDYLELNTTYDFHHYDLRPYQGTTVRVAFLRHSTGGNKVYLDDLTVASYIDYSFNPPTDLTAVAGNAQVVLTWVAPTSGTPAGYKVYRNDVAITTAPVTGLTYTDTSLTNGTSYNYKVTALYTNPDGESVPSNVVAATPTAPVLTPPSNLSAQVNGQTVSLQWTAPGTGEPGTNLTEGFEGSFPPANWTTVVTEPENTWMQAQTISFTSGDVAPHSGTYQAYIHFSFAAQNEWLITPQFTCPANASLTFYTYGYVGSTNLDHYYAKVSTDGGTNWTPLWDATAIQPAGNYTYANGPITIPMSAYAGQQIKVAWQAVDGDGEGLWHVWFLDDLAIGNGTETIRFDKASLAQKSNAASVVANHSVSNGFQSKQEYLLAQKGMTVRSAAPSLSLSKPVTANVLSSRSQSGYNVYRDGSIIYTSTTPTVTTYQDTNVPFGQHVYKVTAVYTDGESTPTNEATVNVEQAPNYVINDDFESYADFSLTMGSWILTDVDAANTDQIQNVSFLHSGSPMAYICFNPSATTPALTGLTPHSGAKVAASFVSLTPPNNDWMITPQLHLGTGSSFKFWAKSYTSAYGLEQFKVGVSTTNSTPNAMTFISGTTAVSAPTTWTEYSYDLSAYNGQDVYVGIQCISNNAFIFFVDDVRVISAGGHVPNEDPAVLPTVTSLSGNYPNPFNPSTTIRYSVKDKGSVKLDIYNSKGQKVKSLVNESKAAGNYNIVWDGRDDQNHTVASGVYFYRMTSGSYTATKKMIMMK